MPPLGKLINRGTDIKGKKNATVPPFGVLVLNYGEYGKGLIRDSSQQKRNIKSDFSRCLDAQM
jgi:hypothetical protein